MSHPPPRAATRRGARSRSRGAWMLALAGCAGLLVWFVQRAPLVQEEVRTTPLPSVESAPVPSAQQAPSAPQPAAVAARADALDGTEAVEDVRLPASAAARAHGEPGTVQPQQPRRARVAATVRSTVRAAASARSGEPSLAFEPQLAVHPLAEQAREAGGADAAQASAREHEAEIESGTSAIDPPAPDPVPEQPPPSAAAPARAGNDRARRAAASSGDLRRAVAEVAPPARKLEATARIDDLTVRGSLTTSEVRRAVERIRPQLAACYTRAARAAVRNGYGALRVEVEIDERGRANAPRASGGALPGLDACVAQVAGKIVGRPPDTGTVKASWKVAFSP